MYNKYAAYPNRPGLVLVRDRWYQLIQVFATDNIRAKIKWFDSINNDLFQYSWIEMAGATAYPVADAIVGAQDAETIARMQHWARPGVRIVGNVISAEMVDTML